VRAVALIRTVPPTPAPDMRNATAGGLLLENVIIVIIIIINKADGRA